MPQARQQCLIGETVVPKSSNVLLGAWHSRLFGLVTVQEVKDTLLIHGGWITKYDLCSSPTSVCSSFSMVYMLWSQGFGLVRSLIISVSSTEAVKSFPDHAFSWVVDGRTVKGGKTLKNSNWGFGHLLLWVSQFWVEVWYFSSFNQFHLLHLLHLVTS